jgi:hypothetical protein
MCDRSPHVLPYGFRGGHQPPPDLLEAVAGPARVAGEIRRIPSLRDSSTERSRSFGGAPPPAGGGRSRPVALTSLDHRAADPGVLAAWLRGHWQTETLTVHQHVHPGTGRQAADRFAARLEG